jgi:hypothetical protein
MSPFLKAKDFTPDRKMITFKDNKRVRLTYLTKN